ncbi:hypothetical protein [Dysgonomonas sp. GY617]|uniref:hypothetical protein n=1 Tax=Dysgonomonas sp. GY617 TaxID=2780420 RepID=UPI0018840070|nr:hypothetical protein [Dysgonomonas sp. GY617]MBF0577155.1 hypothetical protein [Dysgonomonas sp. GY617]
MFKGICFFSLSIFLLVIGFQVNSLNAIFPLESKESTVSSVGFPAPHRGWAGSNIYWNGSNLTFDDIGVVSHADYQGVYFQWGSLWGISSSETYNINTSSLYPPTGGIQIGGVAWDSIPRINDVLVVAPTLPYEKNMRDYSYLEIVHEPSLGIGDICRYLTEQGLAPGSPLKKWRMPTSKEFDLLVDSKAQGVFGFQMPIQDDGSDLFNMGYNYGAVFFPASGYRYKKDGYLTNLGNYGFYWSSSIEDGTGRFLYFNSNNVFPDNNYIQSSALSVRCVLE